MLRQGRLIKARFIDPLIALGWRVSASDNNTYSLHSPDGTIVKTVRVYMRNVTGQSRPQDDKRRMQMMDIENTENVENLLVGWSDEYGVFVAWDPELHIGHAPQAMLSCYTSVLETARDEGYAAGTRNNNLYNVVEK